MIFTVAMNVNKSIYKFLNLLNHKVFEKHQKVGLPTHTSIWRKGKQYEVHKDSQG